MLLVTKFVNGLNRYDGIEFAETLAPTLTLEIRHYGPDVPHERPQPSASQIVHGL